jgi:hypothetical protein
MNTKLRSRAPRRLTVRLDGDAVASRLVIWTMRLEAALLQQQGDGARIHGHARARAIP